MIEELDAPLPRRLLAHAVLVGLDKEEERVGALGTLAALDGEPGRPEAGDERRVLAAELLCPLGLDALVLGEAAHGRVVVRVEREDEHKVGARIHPGARWRGRVRSESQRQTSGTRSVGRCGRATTRRCTTASDAHSGCTEALQQRRARQVCTRVERGEGRIESERGGKMHKGGARGRKRRRRESSWYKRARSHILSSVRRGLYFSRARAPAARGEASGGRERGRGASGCRRRRRARRQPPPRLRELALELRRVERLHEEVVHQRRALVGREGGRKQKGTKRTLRSSNEHSRSSETDMTAPKLSNSPQ